MKNLFSIIAILVCSITYAQDNMLVHTATADNVSENVTFIDHPDLNGNPSACLNFVHNWNPGNETGVYNNNPDGLWYNSANQRWAIYNENIVDMILGASFNVYIAEDGQCIDHVATAENIDGSSTDIDHPLFNGENPGPYAFMNTYYNPNAVYNSGNWATYYYTSGAVRSIFEQNNGDVPLGAAFKIAIPGTSTTRFTHTATTANIFGNYTQLDHPDLNNNQDATLLFLHYYGVGGAGTFVHLDAQLGTFYDGTNWNIYTENITPMLEGVAFDIVIAPNTTLGVSNNTVQDNTRLYPNPALDNIFITAPNTTLKRITIHNILGVEIGVYKTDSTQKTINISGLSSGTYFAKIETEQATKTVKFIKL